MRFSGVSVLVTGAAGFLGLPIASRLAREGATVIASVHHKAVSFPRNVTVVPGDLTDARTRCKALEKLVRAGGYPAVIHLAALSHPDQREKKLSLLIKINVRLVGQLLGEMAERNIRRFLFSSTSHVYGYTGRKPARETSPTRPLGPYGASKLDAENLIRDLSGRLGVSSQILRMSNVYGARSPQRRVAGAILRQLCTHAPRVRVQSAEPVRDFLYVDDAVDVYLKLLDATREPGVEIDNVCYGRSVSIGTLLRIACRAAGRTVPSSEHRESEHDRVCLSNAKVRRRTGWAPKVSLLQGLRRSLEELQASGERPSWP